MGIKFILRFFEVCGDLVLLVKSRTGKDLLMLNGYTYYQHKQLRDGYRWSCTQMGSRSCRAYLHVTQEKLVVRAHTEHTHPPSTYFLEKIRQNFAMNKDEMHSFASGVGISSSDVRINIANMKGRTGM